MLRQNSLLLLHVATQLVWEALGMGWGQAIQGGRTSIMRSTTFLNNIFLVH